MTTRAPSTTGVGGDGGFRVATFIKEKSEQALRNANVQKGSTIMAEKKPSGTLGDNIPVKTNMHRLDMMRNNQVYRYEVALFGIGVNSRTGQETRIDLTLRSNLDYFSVERRRICHAVFKTFKEREANTVIGSGNMLFYDLQRILYATKPLINVPKDVNEWVYSDEQIHAVEPGLPMDFPKYVFKVIPVADNKFCVKLGDFTHLNSNAEDIDRGLEQFLDIATAQDIFDRSDEFTNFSSSLFYLLQPGNYGFTLDDLPNFASNQSFLGVGINKGVRSIQASGGTTTGLVMQVKKSPFHMNAGIYVWEKVRAIVGDNFHTMSTEEIKNHMERFLKGLCVMTDHNPNRKERFEIHSLTNTNSNTHAVVSPRDGTSRTILEYYTQRYNFPINYPNLPLVVRLKGREHSHYPMESLLILDDQRVKTGQQTPAQIQEMIKKAAVPPAKLSAQAATLVGSMRLPESEYLNAASLRFNARPIETNARILPPPELEFGHNKREKPRLPNCSWKGDGYLVPAKCAKWAAIALSTHGRDQLSEKEWKDFVKQFQQKMASKGMQFAEPRIQVLRMQMQEGEDKVAKVIHDYCNEGYEFLLIAHPDAADDVHHGMKYNERKTEVITQGLKMTTVKNVLYKTQWQTMDNIINKTNIKMGGLNYAPITTLDPELRQLLGRETLIIGFGMNQPAGGLGALPKDEHSLRVFPSLGRNGNLNGPRNGLPNGNQNGANGQNGAYGPNGNRPQHATGPNGNRPQQATSVDSTTGPPHERPTAPSVVGFSANIGSKHPFEFIGDFYYQPPLRDEKVEIIGDVVKRCLEAFRASNGQYPRRVIVFRNGCSEGQFAGILSYEVPLMRAAMRDLGCNAKVTLLVVNKMQAVRLFRQQIDARAKPPEQNIPPGTVLDKEIVHPKWTEFYLNSHRAIQGTASTPKYTLLLDENSLSMNSLQSLAHDLCFGHQIVYSPTSLPCCCYIAMMYAKRGRNLFNSWADSLSAGREVPVGEFEMLTEKLSYLGTEWLKLYRLNA